MVVTLWRWCNRCGAAVLVETLRGRPASILRYRLIPGDLLLDRTLGGGLAFGQRRHRGHGGTRRAGCDRRLVLLVAAAEPDIGQPLQQRQAGLLRVLLLRFTPGL